MTVTSDVILDLLPMYVAGEVSQDTRKLVEAYLEENPRFRLWLDRLTEKEALLASAHTSQAADTEKVTFERTRRAVQRRNLVLGVAIAYSLAPLSFFYEKHSFAWVMLRDAPAMASLFLAIAVACWIGYFVMRRHTRLTGV